MYSDRKASCHSYARVSRKRLVAVASVDPVPRFGFRPIIRPNSCFEESADCLRVGGGIDEFDPSALLLKEALLSTSFFFADLVVVVDDGSRMCDGGNG